VENISASISSTTSVKVPPTSAPMRMVPPAICRSSVPVGQDVGQ
jgi:hypothetical protein